MRYKVQPTIPTPWTTPFPQLFRWIFDLANSVKIRFSLRILMNSLKSNGRTPLKPYRAGAGELCERKWTQSAGTLAADYLRFQER